MNNGPMIVRTGRVIYVDIALWLRFQQACAQCGTAPSSVIEDWIRQFLSQQEQVSYGDREAQLATQREQ